MRARVLCSLLPLVWACGPKQPAETDSTTAGGSTTSTSEITSSTGGEPTTGATSTTASTGGSSTTASTGGSDACTCGPEAYCDWPRDDCGAGTSPAVCTPRPRGCPKLGDPACGCDGQIYDSVCWAADAGIDVAIDGRCETPDDTFACGYQFCFTGTHYCEVLGSDVADEPTVFTCRPLPAGCDPAICACLADEQCGELCEQLPTGDLKVTCPGG